MTTGGRHRAREIVLQALYALEMSGESKSDSLSDFSSEDKLSDETLRFALELYHLVRENGPAADKEIVKLSEHWRIERIAMVDRLIIRMALVELEKCPDVPVRVVLNEAIELAKSFSTGDSSSFVNGILDKFVRNRSAGVA
ncbi:MAG: transcription antitermination factor NusB [Candidatus Zixiibacteriota bacterium]